MCESTVYVEENGVKTEIMSNIARVLVRNDKIICIDFVGMTKELKNKIKEINLIEHEIILEP